MPATNLPTGRLVRLTPGCAERLDILRGLYNAQSAEASRVWGTPPSCRADDRDSLIILFAIESETTRLKADVDRLRKMKGPRG